MQLKASTMDGRSVCTASWCAQIARTVLPTESDVPLFEVTPYIKLARAVNRAMTGCITNGNVKQLQVCRHTHSSP